jgi:enoyl-CoA hydratase/carnithine racemase
MYEDITYAVDGPSAVVTLNRPDKLNALTRRMLAEIKHALCTAEADEAVTGIIVTGEGRGFCAGMDMQALSNLGAEGGTSSRGDEDYGLDCEPGDPDMGPDFTHALTYIMAIRKPVIAVVNGPCAGMGLSLAGLCDMRFAAEDAVFMAAFSQRGLVAEHGLSWILPRIMGPDRALDILWSSRRVSGREAVNMGLATRCVPTETALDEAKAYIEGLAASTAPVSLMRMKRQP